MQVSIIVPAYNVSNYIGVCIDSIRRQSFSNWELIIIDDGSTDNSLDICQRYSEVDSRIRVIHQHNSGQGTARNHALTLASGEYICFVDADDLLIDENTLAKSVEYFDNNSEIDIIQFPYIRFKDHQELNSSEKPFYENITILNSKKEFIEHTDIINSVRPTEKVLKTAPWGKLYRTRLFNDIRFPERMVFEDTYMFCNLFEKTNKIAFVNTGHTDIINSVRPTEKVLKTAPWGKLYRTRLFNDIRFPERMVFEDTYMFCNLFEKTNKIAFVNTGLYGNFERVGSTTCGAPAAWKMEDKIKAFCKIFATLQKYSPDKYLHSQFYIWLLNLISAFYSMFGKNFHIEEELSFIISKKSCLRHSGVLGRIILTLGISNYIRLRTSYYNAKARFIKKR